MNELIAPHPSTKYAVIRIKDSHGPLGYAVAAVHAISHLFDFFFGSVQFPVGDSHVYRAPAMIPTDQIMAMAQTTEAAWKYKRVLETQDREAEQR